jgi:HNH endonuclease
MPMEIEHLTPLAGGGQTVEENLWLSCRRCNQFKGTQTLALDSVTAEQVALFNPRLQDWNEHFRWNEDGTEIVGITSVGRATADALELNHPVIVVTRRLWITAGWWPPNR